MTFAEEVRAGLSREGQRELPPSYFYDEVGSALFEVISVLPEYGLTRADERLLRDHAEEIAGSAVAPGEAPAIVAELGSGSGRKTRWILEALGRRGAVLYYPIEISPAALARCQAELSSIEGLTVAPVEAPYLDGLRQVAARRAAGPAAGRSLLALFLGSTIGNFDRPAAERFLSCVRGHLAAGDGLLLGTDLLKPAPRLIAAYDDPIGVTAAFNLNLLSRINRELGGNFDLPRWRHEARWDDPERRIEMHLVSRLPQTVSIPGAGLEVAFRAGESIRTESCHKFTSETAVGMGERAGFRERAQWIDEEWPFAETLFEAI